MAFFYTAATLSAITAIHQLFRFHAIHSLFTDCIARTDTRRQFKFQDLKHFFVPAGANLSKNLPKLVNFEFEEEAVLIEVLAGRYFSTPLICHHTQEMCRETYIVSGDWFMGGFRSGTPGDAPPELPFTWRSINIVHLPPKKPCRLRLYGSETARQVDHIIVSAVQDAEIYFRLCSTPLWLRLFYSATKAISAAAANVLARRILWIQIRGIYFCNDIWEFRGTCTFFQMFWPFFNEPDWVKRFELWSEHYRSKQFLRLNYWLGRIFLGMDSEYPQYNIATSKEMNMLK